MDVLEVKEGYFGVWMWGEVEAVEPLVSRGGFAVGLMIEDFWFVQFVDLKPRLYFGGAVCQGWVGGSGNCFSGDEVLDIISEAVEPKNHERKWRGGGREWDPGEHLITPVIDAIIVRKLGRRSWQSLRQVNETAVQFRQSWLLSLCFSSTLLPIRCDSERGELSGAG